MPLDLLTPDEAASELKVPVRTVVQLCAQGRIPGAAKVGRRWRIPRAALERLFAFDEASVPSAAGPRGDPTGAAARKVRPAKTSRAEILALLRGGKP